MAAVSSWRDDPAGRANDQIEYVKFDRRQLDGFPSDPDFTRGRRELDSVDLQVSCPTRAETAGAASTARIRAGSSSGSNGLGR